MNPLILAARHGPYVLIAGLVAGLTLPGLAHLLSPLIPQMVVVLLFVSVLRMAPGAIFGSLGSSWRDVLAVLGLQLAAPLAVLGGAQLTGWQDSPFVLALVLMAAAPSIVSSPNICLMIGLGQEAAMRLMVTGTALMPLTVIPVFWLAPGLGSVGGVLGAALRLFAVIALTTGVAVAIRVWLLRRPSVRVLQQLDGASAIALAVFVIGLMPAVGEAARASLSNAALWLGFALLVNFGAQVVAFMLTRNRMARPRATALGLIAGNRNIALFFVSLPPEIIAPVLVFIGCYQIPMYLTPLVMRRLYARPEMR